MEDGTDYSDLWANDPLFETEEDLNEWQLGSSKETKRVKETFNVDQEEASFVCQCGDKCIVIYNGKGRRHGCCQTISYAWEQKVDSEDEEGGEERVVAMCVTNIGEL